jgi:hypothetical protein
VPNASSKANTDFMRCSAVGFGADERSAANCGGATTRALGGGGATTGGGGCGVSMRGGAGGVTARATDAAGSGKLVTTSAGSDLVSPWTTSTGLPAAGVAGFMKIPSRTAASFACSCFMEAGVESAPEAPTGEATGLGQLSTPPTWTVPHQAQNAGRVLSAGRSGFMAAGAGLGTGRTNGSAGAGGAAGCGGFDSTMVVLGWTASSRCTAPEPESCGNPAT